MADVEEVLAGKFAVLGPLLDERQRRAWLGVEARALGRGGVSAVAGATGISRTTVTKAVRELDEPDEPDEDETPPAGRVRRAGAGRPPLTQVDPGLLDALEWMVDRRPGGTRSRRCGGRRSRRVNSPTRSTGRATG